MRAVRLAGSQLDYLVVGSDSGRIVILEYDQEQNVFNKLHQETFGKSGCRRIVPGQYLAADPKGRAIMIAAVEKQKFVYVLNRDAQARLTISSPLEAHKSHTIVFDLVALDVGYENPIFATLEFDYKDVDSDHTGSSLNQTEKMLTYYELDLGLNHVVRKWSDSVDSSANLLIPLCGGSDGPSGVLVCSENYVTWYNQNYAVVRLSIPRRSSQYEDLSRGIIIDNYVVHKMKTELGDIFKITADYDSDVVKELKIKYFDTIKPSVGLYVFKSGFLFAPAQFGNHFLYQIEGLADDEDEFEFSSGEMDMDESSGPQKFTPRALKYLAPVDEIESFAPIVDSQVLNLTEDETPQIYAICGRGASSSMKIMRTGMEVNELVVYPLPGNPYAVWAVKARKSDEFDSFIVISFVNATLVLQVGETVEEVSDSGFWNSTQTLDVHQIGEDSLLQIYPSGLRHIRADKRVNEWQCPENTTIVQSACNNRQVAIALSSNEIIYFELDSIGQLNEFHERKEMSASVNSMSIGPIPDGRTRSKFLAVGCADQTVRLLSLDPDSCLEPVGMQAVTDVPSSLLLIEMMDYGSDKLHSTLYLNIGLRNGVFVRSTVDAITGSLTDSRNRYLGGRPVKLFSVTVKGEPAVLALSSRPWLNYSHQRRSHLTPLTYDTLEFGSSFNSEQCLEAVVSISENNLRIFSFEKLGVEYNTTTIPLEYTPRRFLLEPFHRNFIILETDHGVYPNSANYGEEASLEQLGLIRAPKGSWASCIRVLNPLTGETVQQIYMEQGEAAVSISPCIFHSDPLTTYYAVGASKDLNLNPRNCKGGVVILFRLIPGGTLQFVHKTEVEDVPNALCAFQGRLLVGVGKYLRLYDLGKKKLLKKCETKTFPQRITALQAQGDRILVSDIQESVSFARYLFQENKIMAFADDTKPRWVSKAIMLDYNTVVVGDKFGNVSVLRIPEAIAEDLDDDVVGNRLLYERPYLQGAPHKLETLCEYFVGDMITSLHKAVLLAGGRDIVLYTTLMGGIGILAPFISKENVDLFQTLEMHMRNELPPLCGREHNVFRSFYFPGKNVVDGEMVEQFAMLDADKKRSIAEELDRSASEISRQIELMRRRVS